LLDALRCGFIGVLLGAVVLTSLGGPNPAVAKWLINQSS
jgi:hypothetical protein